MTAQQRLHDEQPAPRWLRPRLAQLAWAGLALSVFALLPFRLRQMYADAHSVCSGMDCGGAQLAGSQVQLLRGLGLSLDAWGLLAAAVILVFACVYGAVAAVIIWRKPSDRMAVVTAVTLILFGGLTFDIGAQPPSSLPSPLWLPYDLLGLLGGYCMFAFVLLFPSGQLALRWPVLLILPLAVFQAGEAVTHYAPFDVGKVPVPLTGVAWALMFGAVIYVQVYRYRYVSNPVERQQTKWAVLGITVAMLAMTGTFLLYPFAPGHPALGLAALPATHAAALLIPLSIGIAILRSHLWDIDLLINRTLVYGLLTATLAVVYVGSVLVLQALFQAVAGSQSDLAVAISTLAIAALFTPLRHRFQAFIDRRFYRQKYDAARSLAALGTRLQHEVDLEHLTGDVLHVVHETVQPYHASLWLRGQGAHLDRPAGKMARSQ